MKRLIIGCALALVALTLTPRPAAPAAPAVLKIDPKCVNNSTGTMTLTFDGTGFTDDANVQIFDEDKPNRPPILAGTNKSGTFHVQATVPAKPPGYYFYRALEGPHETSTGISVPCGTISIEPNCGPVGAYPEMYKITVKGVSFPPAFIETPNDVDVFFGQVKYGTGTIGFDQKFTVIINVPRRPAGSYSISATDKREMHTAFIRFNVPCPETSISTNTTATTSIPDVTVTTAKPPPPPSATPSCVLDPPVGPPGFVTQARCTGFPPNTIAALRWDPGLGVSSVAVGPQGTFVTPMLIMPRDRLGPRTFIAEAGGVSAKAPFVVSPPSVAPSGGDVATSLLPQLVRRY